MLPNLSKLQTFTLLHHEEFLKSCTSNKSEVLLAKAHGNTHLVKSLKPTLDYSQPILLIYESGKLLWSLVGKNNPSKTLYLKYYQTKREIYWNYRDLSKMVMENKCWKGREMEHTHLERWTGASGKWVLLRHECSSHCRIAHGWKRLSMDLSSKLS
jgi:hypothetical protein